MFRPRSILLLTAGFYLLSAQVPAAAGSPSKGLKVDRLLQQAIEKTAEIKPEPELAQEISVEALLAEPPTMVEEDVEKVPPPPVLALPTFPAYVEEPPPKPAPFKWPEKPGRMFNGMLFLPSLLVKEGWNSNLLASEIDEDGAFVSQVMPQLRVEIPDIRHDVVFEGVWEWRKHIGSSASEDQNNIQASLEGHLTAERGIFVPFSISGARTHEEREDDLTRQLPDEPFEQGKFSVNSGLQFKPGGFAVTLLGHYLQERFENGNARVGGAPVVREDADRDITALEFNNSFDLNPRNTLMLWGTVGKRAYVRRDYQAGAFTGVKRDSSTWSGMTSWMFDYPGLSGHISVGVDSFSYEDPAIADEREYVGDMEIDHRINETTTVNFQLERYLFEDEEIVDPIIGSRFGFYMDHEFRDNILLATGTDYNYLEFSDSTRTDETWDFRALADYLVNDFLAFGAEYVYTTRDSDAAGLDFSRSIFMLRARGRL